MPWPFCGSHAGEGETAVAKWTCCVLGVAGLVLAAGAPARAADEPVVTVEANIGAVTDYRYRGLSLSDNRAAAQGGIDAAFRGGWFAGTWTSNVSDTGGSKREVDLYGGRGGSFGELDYKLTAYAYVYPGGHDVSYVEAQAQLGATVGRVILVGLVSYAPPQQNIGPRNIYVGGEAEVELPVDGLSLRLRGGYEDGFYDGKWDWEAGLAYSVKALTFTLGYVGSDYSGEDEAGRAGRGAVVAGVAAAF